MNHFFAPTYVLLCCLILMETLLLWDVLRKAMWLQQFYESIRRPGEPDPSNFGKELPEFLLPSLEMGMYVKSTDLEGQPVVLCFLRAQPTALDPELMAAVHAWWHSMNRHVYLVCVGAAEECRRAIGENTYNFPLGHFICDEKGALSGRFGIKNLPQAVELDEKGHVKRFGRPESLEPTGERKNSGNTTTSASTYEYGKWPDDRTMSGAAFARVDTTVSCVLSRFRLKSPVLLIPFYLTFRRIRREARDIPGLLQALFLIENLRTCYTLSLWKDEWSIVEFGRVRAHIDAANSAFKATYREDLNRAEIWSAQFRLWAVSCHNSSWEGLDTEAALGEQWVRREELARSSREEQRFG